ncbi:hypothetical protein PVK06_030143 [Gossypium arboreum]|uniref:Uncharacterized protein n=1 Tax=Gossypium arboreum TaxID=29729 RepID=A0ABR0NMH8_GOSAR|nr:hypothetical protein PVK06_030143 [Gossypium arboreum]
MGPHVQIGLACVAHTAWPINPHAYVGPHAQLGLTRVAHTATLRPSHGRVLRTTMPSSTTRLCLAHGEPHG